MRLFFFSLSFFTSLLEMGKKVGMKFGNTALKVSGILHGKVGNEVTFFPLRSEIDK